jgi:hypothetical protein
MSHTQPWQRWPVEVRTAPTYHGRPQLPHYTAPAGVCLICFGRGGCGWFETAKTHWTPCWHCKKGPQQ